MQPTFPYPEILGTYHQFGPFGIPYQVLRPVRNTGEGWTVEIAVPETSERLEYSVDAVLNCPDAL